MKKYIRVGEPEVVEVGYRLHRQGNAKGSRMPLLTGMRVAIDDLATTNPAAGRSRGAGAVCGFSVPFVAELDHSGFIDSLYR